MNSFNRGYNDYLLGMQKRAEISDDELKDIVEQVALRNGIETGEDTDENDYKSGIGDFFRALYKPRKIMAKKQRRFEKEYNDAGGFDKMLMQLKHPIRSVYADGLAGAKGLGAYGALGLLLNTLSAGGMVANVARRIREADDDSGASGGNSSGLDSTGHGSSGLDFPGSGHSPFNY